MFPLFQIRHAEARNNIKHHQAHGYISSALAKLLDRMIDWEPGQPDQYP